MASQLINAEFNVLNIAGESGFDGIYETFAVDQETLYNMVLENFYKTKD